MNKLVYVQAGTVEDVFRAMDAITNKVANDPEKGKRLITIVWDSVAATSTYAEVEGNYGDHTIGLAARLIGQGLRKFIPIVSTHNICLVFINQLRMKIGGMGYGDPYDTPGGKAIGFHSSVRVRLQHYSQLKEKDTKVQLGRVVKAEIKKNKVAPPMRTQFFTIKWGTKPGAWIDEASSLLDACEACKIVKKLSTISFELEMPNAIPVKFNRKSWEDMMNDQNIYAYIKEKLEDKYIITEKNVTADNLIASPASPDEGE
jgi:protein RecA